MNTLGDLNAYLFEQMERLNDYELKDEKLQQEVSRAKAVSSVAKDIISNANLVLQAEKFSKENWDDEKETPRMLKAE